MAVGEEGRVELGVLASSADGRGGFAVGLEGREGGGVAVTTISDGSGDAAFFGEVEVEVMVETVILGVLF